MGMTKLNSKTLWPILVIAGLAVACFCFFLLFYPSHFYFKGQNQLFLMSWQYVSTLFAKPLKIMMDGKKQSGVVLL